VHQTDPRPWVRHGLWAAAIAVGVVILRQTVQLSAPLFTSSSGEGPKQSEAKVPDYTYEPWYDLAVQDGRTKPFQTACVEAVRHITGRSHFEGLDPVAVVLAWKLGEGAAGAQAGTNWETYPFILCDHHGLRRQIQTHGDGAGRQLTKAQETGKYMAPAELRRSSAFDDLLGEVARKRKEMQGKADRELTTEHLKAEEVGRRLHMFDALCGKTSTRLFRNALVSDRYVDLGEYADIDGRSPEEALAKLAGQRVKLPDPLPFPQSQFNTVREAFKGVRVAYLSGDGGRFDRASRTFFQVLADESVGPYPGVSTIPWEILLNRWQPFLWSWITMLAALVLVGTSLMSGARLCYLAGMSIYVASLTVQALGLALRIVIAGRPPVSNMYESVIFVAFMAAVFALILEWIYRRGFIALAGAAVAALGLMLADQLPLALDPKISPIVPVLRTNYWLTVHVLTIVSSYAAGTLAWGLGNLTLGMLIFGHANPATHKTLAHYTYRALQIAVLLLAAGTFLGGWWAAESWGRFWGWDPKEVGALIALVCYVIPLHARYLGWVDDFGLAIAAVLCYASILLSWYVVNFLVAAGLHSYGFGAGGAAWILWARLLNIEWVLIAALRYLPACPFPCTDRGSK